MSFAANPDATNDAAASTDVPESFVANPDATNDAAASADVPESFAAHPDPATEIVATPKNDAITAYPHEPDRVG